MSYDSQWRVYRNEETGDVEAVAIVHIASEHVLEYKWNGLEKQGRREFAERLVSVLNAARDRGEL